MGIFGEGETSSVVAQLRLFEQAMGFPKVPGARRRHRGRPGLRPTVTTPGRSSGTSIRSPRPGMAPDVSQLDFYFAKSLFDADIFADFDYWANDPNGPRQMNASFGECEENPTNPVTGPARSAALRHRVRRRARGGRQTRSCVRRRSRDARSSPRPATPARVVPSSSHRSPAPATASRSSRSRWSTTRATATTPCASAAPSCRPTAPPIPQSAQRAAETSWTFGGGGTSYFIPEPSFQAGVANVDHPLSSALRPAIPTRPASAPICRGVPDVADMSGQRHR